MDCTSGPQRHAPMPPAMPAAAAAAAWVLQSHVKHFSCNTHERALNVMALKQVVSWPALVLVAQPLYVRPEGI